MDPAAITSLVVREVARDGNYGAHARDVWKFASQAAKQPLDDALRDSVWLWLAQHPAIHIDHDRAYASVDLQWLELTGSPKHGSIVPQLAFNVLCAVAHSREAGISTVDVAKQVGQDPRSLFGRVQLLVDLGLVQRFPVIEKGSSTHRIVLMPYVSHHTQGQSAANPFIDKQMARKQIAEFCKSGPQGLRLKRDVVAQIGAQLTSNAQRRRPLVISLLKDLETQGFVRSTQVYDPAVPSKAYSCVQFIKDYDVGAPEKRSNSAWTDTAVDSGDALDAEEAGLDDTESQSQAVDGHTAPESVDLSRAVAGDGVIESDSVQANVTFPLVNQIHDLVVAAGPQGTSAMELTRRLTGKSYSKAMGKYLDALTGGTKSKAQSATQPPELGHLSLIKGVDFAHRVKYYRYFTRMTYSGCAVDAQWGSFSSDLPVRDATLSLKSLDAKSKLPLPGGCSIIETEDGDIKPIFHGDKATAGKVLLVSDPSRHPGSLTTVAPAKRRGRPPKNAPKPPPESLKPIEAPAPPPLQTVSFAERHWVGGSAIARDSKASSSAQQQVAIWLRPPDALLDAHTTTKESVSESGVSSTQSPGSGKKSNGVSSKGGLIHTDEASAPKPSVKSEPQASTEKSLGSLAFTRRLETLRGVIRANNGAVVGGQDLVDRFNAAVNGDSLVDRKTIDRVTKNLVKQGTLRQIFVNIPTMTGIHLMKYILYDPKIIGDADESTLIAELKHELNDRTRLKQSLAAKAAGNQRSLQDSSNRQEMTVEQASAFRPLLGQRLATTSTRQRKPMATKKFGVSAAEVAGSSGTRADPKRTKREKGRQHDLVQPPENMPMADFYGSVAIMPKPSPAAKDSARRPRSVPAVDPDWLFRAAVISRSLFPRGKNVDWALVARNAPPGVSEKNVKQQWHNIHSETSGGAAAIAKRTNEWEDMFAEAYASDDIVYLKPSDPGFTLQYYIDWWRVAEQSRALSRSADGSSSAEKKSRLRDLTLKSRNIEPKLLDPLASLQSQPSMIRSEELLTKTIFGVPLDSAPMRWKQTLKLSDNAAKLRAVIAADNGASFSAKDAAQELGDVSEEGAKQALSELERYKYIQWAVSDPEKIPAGRPYVLSEKVMNMLAPPAKLERDLPSRASLAVSEMTGSGLVDIPETVDESQMVPLLEMATFGLDGKHVQLQRSGEHRGRLSNHYRSRDIDKGELDCDIRAKVCDAPDSVMAVDRTSILPPISQNPAHPCIWETSRLTSHKIWNTVAYKILATVLFRPGITCDALAQALRHVLEKDEVHQAVEALVEGSALSSDGGGLRATPGWFECIS